MLFTHLVAPAGAGVLCLVVLVAPAPTLGQEAPADDEPPPIQGVPVPSELERDAPEEVEEITVTGTRSDATDIQSEGRAITAFSMEELDRANVINVDQLAFNVPALHVGQQGSQSIITLRGVSTENASITGEPGVAFHVDGVSYGRPAAARVAFFDLEGLQVLRGPQGSQGGKNATAGWIHVITRKPHDEFEVSADFQWGSYDNQRVRAALNYPINEYAQARFALYMEDHDGYQRNLFFKDDDRDGFDADDFGWRGHLRLLPRDDLDVLFTYNYFESKGVGPVQELVSLPASRRCTPLPPPLGTSYDPLTRMPAYAGCPADPRGLRPIYAATGFDLDLEPQFQNFENPATAGEPRVLATRASLKPHLTYLDEASSQDNRFWGWTSTLNWDAPPLPLFGETQLKAIGGFQRTSLATYQDLDAADISLFFGDVVDETDQWSAELKWSGSGLDELMSWKLSTFWVRESSVAKADVLVRIGFLRLLEIDQSTENTSYGLALSNTWQLRDNLALTLGGRYTKDQKRAQLLRSNPPATESAFPHVLSICTGGAVDLLGRESGGNQFGDRYPDDGIPWCEESFRHTTGDATLEWWPGEDSLLYGRVASGFKAGGFSANQATDYAPELIWAFALGSKNTFFDERLILNLEAYFYHYRDMQLVLVDGLSRRTDNADAEMQGVELEFRAEPFVGLRLNGNVAYQDTEFTEYVEVDPLDALVSTRCRYQDQRPDLRPEEIPLPRCQRDDYRGNEVPRSPEWSLTLGAEYAIDLGRYGILTPRIQYYWQDDTWFRGFNKTPENSGPNARWPGGSEGNDLQEAYHLTDIKLIWTSSEGRWTAEAFVRNLEDEVVYQNVFVSTPLLGSPQFAWYGHPRLYGFVVGYRY